MNKGEKPKKESNNRYDNALSRHQRPNLFPDPDLLARVADGHRRAITAIEKSSIFHAHLCGSPKKVQFAFKSRLGSLIRLYWDRVEYDTRIKNVGCKSELITLSGTLEKLIRLAEQSLSASTKQLLSDQLIPRHEQRWARGNELITIVANNKRLLSACNALTAEKGTRQGREALVLTSHLVIAQWTKVTGLPFKHRRWQIEEGHERDGVWTAELDAPDAHFVQLMIQAFDPTVTLSQVRSALTEIVKRENGKKRAQNPE